MTITTDKLAKLIARLEPAAAQKTQWDMAQADGSDFIDMNSNSGGNFDDCYAIGQKDGEIEIAREILEILGSP